jgi:hypothetical protein
MKVVDPDWDPGQRRSEHAEQTGFGSMCMDDGRSNASQQPKELGERDEISERGYAARHLDGVKRHFLTGTKLFEFHFRRRCDAHGEPMRFHVTHLSAEEAEGDRYGCDVYQAYGW